MLDTLAGTSDQLALEWEIGVGSKYAMLQNRYELRGHSASNRSRYRYVGPRRSRWCTN